MLAAANPGFDRQAFIGAFSGDYQFWVNVAAFVLSMLLAYSRVGYAITEWVVAGTPGAERPMEAFLPPGFSM